MVADRARGPAAAETAAAAARFLGQDQIDRAIGADAQHVVVTAEIGVGLSVLHIGAVASDARDDRLAAFGMARDFARQRQQGQRLLERDVARRQALGQRRTFRLFAFAQLHIGAKAAIAQRDFVARDGIIAQHTHARTRVTIGAGRQRAGELAFWIIRAADEGAELGQFQRQLSGVAGRAGARIAAVALVWKNVRREQVVEIVEHLRGAQILRSCKGF